VESLVRMNETLELPHQSPTHLSRSRGPVQHGAYVKARNALRVRNRQIERLMQKLDVALPHLTPADKPAVRGWCELEVIAARLFA
jgi:hypothetical protein